MSILHPIIRSRLSPPRIGGGRDFSFPPKLQAEIASVSQIDAALVEDRVIIFADDFRTGWQLRPGYLPWSFDPLLGFNPLVQDWELTTLNGAPAVAAIWHATNFGEPGGGIGTGDDRIFARMRPASMAAGLEEAWFTFEMMYSDPFSAPIGGKQPGLSSFGGSTGGKAVSCASPTWSARHMFNTQNPPSGPAPGVVGGVQRGHQYIYHIDKIQDRNNYTADLGLGFPGSFPLGELLIFEQYVKLNDPGAANGINITKITINGVQTTFLATTNLRYYCTDNKDTALIREMIWGIIWGGNTHAWDPLFTSTLTYGRFKVEVPT